VATTKHILTNINPQEHTATCSICGDTKAYFVSRKGRSKNGWYCHSRMTLAYRKYYKRSQKTIAKNKDRLNEKYKNSSEFREQKRLSGKLYYNRKKEDIRVKFMRVVYNLTPEEYEQILAFQNGVCSITGKPPVNNKLHIDHDHKTGLIRGLISWRVNHALAAFNDDPELLRRAADYLENPPAVAALNRRVYGVIGKAKLKKKMVYGTGSEEK
jgi:hypothetical protein